MRWAIPRPSERNTGALFLGGTGCGPCAHLSWNLSFECKTTSHKCREHILGHTRHPRRMPGRCTLRAAHAIPRNLAGAHLQGMRSALKTTAVWKTEC